MKLFLAILAAAAAVVLVPARWVLRAGRWFLEAATPASPVADLMQAVQEAEAAAPPVDEGFRKVCELVKQAAREFTLSTAARRELVIPDGVPLNVGLWLQSLKPEHLIAVAKATPEALDGHLRLYNPTKIHGVPMLKDESAYLPPAPKQGMAAEGRSADGKGSMRSDKTAAENARIVEEILEQMLTPQPGMRPR